jgi:hypothetical protein
VFPPAGHKTLVPQELKKYGREDIMVVVGGVSFAIINSYLMPEL